MVTKVKGGYVLLIESAVRQRLMVTMRMFQRVGALLGGAALGMVGSGAQTHRVAKPETVVRAVAVYEWTGDLAKPAASRLVPITLFVDQHLEDAGVYLARPIPFALMPENLYELDLAGVPKGTVEMAYARRLQALNAAAAYDDGWFGYGSYKPLPPPRKQTQRKASTTMAKVETSGGADKPRFATKTGDATPASVGADNAKAATDDAKINPEADPDRPTMKLRAELDPATTSPAVDDPDRPTMKRRVEPDPSTTTTATPAVDDPDRPTLKRHTADDAKKTAKEQTQAGVTGAGGLLGDDPNRPSLHRGKPTHTMTEADLPKLSGLPAGLQQMVAVSDAANRPVHDFTRLWDDDAERVAVLGRMQARAQAELATYASVPGGPAAPVQKLGAKRRGAAPPRTGQTRLLDEKLNGYLLSYGDAPTFVYQAHTEGAGAELRYITLVAQRDAQGELVTAMHTVTDAAHLDRTARLHLIDAVDVEASNRASLLFELRGEGSRQFGVYRILGQHAEQIFTTGTTQ